MCLHHHVPRCTWQRKLACNCQSDFFWSPVHEYIPSQTVLSGGTTCHLVLLPTHFATPVVLCIKWCPVWPVLKDVGSSQYLLFFSLAFSLASLETQSQTPAARRGFKNVGAFNSLMFKTVLDISLRAGKQFLPPQFSFPSPIYITLDFPQYF